MGRGSSVRRLLFELRRRHVVRVAVWYGLGAWFVVQVAETTFPYVGLADFVVTAVIVLAIAGFPLAALAAWIFDITPEGIQVTDASESAPAGELREASADRDRHGEASVPVPATALVGRGKELTQALALLESDAVRVLTLTGAAGTGKTRLAQEIARHAAARFPGGVHWVPLGAITDAALVAPTIGLAFGQSERGPRGVLETVADRLPPERMLLVLDNFEQVIEAAGQIAALVARSPALTMLVTSRAPLRIGGEHEFPVPPLDAPGVGADPARMVDAPAVRLFAARARNVSPDFEVTERNAATVAAICRRLDGLPLAIELAAVRVKVLTPDAMLGRLERRLPLLTGGPRDLPARQRTLREAIGWSYDLLSEPERGLFRRLAAFAGSCSLEAVQEVCGWDAGDEMIDLLQVLADHSLLQRVSTAGAVPRFAMLETIREYGTERITESGEDKALRQRHAAYFVALAETAEPQLVGARQAEWLERLEPEHDNFRAALDWSYGTGQTELALRLAVALWKFWEARGHLSEGRRWLAGLLDADTATVADRLRLKALYAAGVLADAQRDYAAARACFQQTLAAYRAADDRWGVANALNNLGVIALREADFATARALYEESVALWRDLDNDSAVALALNNLGNVARLQGDHAEAKRCLEESLAICRSREDTNGCALTLGLLGEVACALGEASEAARLFEESLALFRRAGNAPQVANSLIMLGALAANAGGGAEARPRFGEALRISLELGMPRGAAEALESLAQVADQEGDARRTIRLATAAALLRERSGTTLSGDERTGLDAAVQAARTKLGPAAATRVERETRAEGVEAVACEALEWATKAGPARRLA